VSLREQSERNLQLNSFVTKDSDIFPGIADDQNLFNNAENDAVTDQANVLNVAAQIIADRNQSYLEHFEDFAGCLGKQKFELDWRPRYRTITGYGNNLNNPHWGTSGTPFGRFGPKNYDDGVYTVRKSVTGSELPSPRKLVLDVLLKVEKFPRTKTIINTMVNLLVFYVSHDLAHQVPTKAFKNGERIRCCSHGNQATLSSSLSHSACLPVSVGRDDPFYSHSGVRCLNMIRSESASLPSTIQYGEVKNMATSFLDHSLIYGINDAQSREIRTFCSGKLKMGNKNMLPIDNTGNYVKSTERLTILAPFGAMWAVLFARNHNTLADQLANLNPHWNDETLYQEARRINIAWLQHIIITGSVIEDIFTKKINETYNESVDPSTTVEFNTAGYRFLHYFAQPDMLSINDQGQSQSIPISDTFGRIDLLEDHYEDFLRGLLSQPINFFQYTDEVKL
jgi:peroxidase